MAKYTLNAKVQWLGSSLLAMVDAMVDAMFGAMVDTMVDAMVDAMVGAMVDAVVEEPPSVRYVGLERALKPRPLPWHGSLTLLE